MSSRRPRANGVERWVIVGGTFDPIHVGHVDLAHAAVESLAANLGVFAVGSAHCHRGDAVLSWFDRVDLVRRACANEPRLTEATVVGAAGRTLVDVAHQLRAPRRELHFVFGADSAQRLVAWPGGAQLSEFGTLWGVPRDGFDLPVGVHHLDAATRAVSGSQIRAALRAGRTVSHLIPIAIRHDIPSAYRRALAAHPSRRSAQPLGLACSG